VQGIIHVEGKESWHGTIISKKKKEVCFATNLVNKWLCLIIDIVVVGWLKRSSSSCH